MNILQEIQDVAKSEIALYFQHKIYQKLAVVMKQVFNLDARLSDIENLFILKEHRFNEFVYDFLGNKVQLYFLSGLKLAVYLSDNHNFDSPVGAFCCHIEVDDDLNYQSATFQARFNFGRTKTYHSDNTYSSLFLDRCFDKISIMMLKLFILCLGLTVVALRLMQPICLLYFLKMIMNFSLH